MKEEKMILGQGCIYSTDSSKTGLNNNVIVCGGSGCGKTMSISEPLFLETTDSSLIATVAKKRLVYKYKPLFESRGYHVMDMDFADPGLGDTGYDPLMYVKNAHDITSLAQAIVSADPKNGIGRSDPYWNDAAVSLLSAEIAYTLYENDNATFCDVLKMHDGLKIKSTLREDIVSTSYDKRFEKLAPMQEGRPYDDVCITMDDIKAKFLQLSGKDGTPASSVESRWIHACEMAKDEKIKEQMKEQMSKAYGDEREAEKKAALASFACSCWKTFSETPEVTARSIYVSLNTTLDKVFTPQIRETIRCEKKVRFEELGSRKSILFVTTSPVNPSLNLYINMFYSQAIKQLFEFAERRPDGRLPFPVHILCDDFAAGGRIFGFPEYISVFREKGISATILVQSESQLASMYGAADAVTIINNCDSYVYMGGMDIDTARAVSLRLNVPMSEVLNMPVGREIVFRRGEEPAVTSRYDIRKNELYRSVTELYEKTI